MNSLIKIFNLVQESVGLVNMKKFEQSLELLGASNIKIIPKWLRSTMVQPIPIIHEANVERFNIKVHNAHVSYLDAHEIDNIIIYTKIFFVFDFYDALQLFMIFKYRRLVNEIMQSNYGKPNKKLSHLLKLYTGENLTAYINNNEIIAVTNASTALYLFKEFQIHHYEKPLFELLFGTI